MDITQYLPTAEPQIMPDLFRLNQPLTLHLLVDLNWFPQAIQECCAPSLVEMNSWQRCAILQAESDVWPTLTFDCDRPEVTHIKREGPLVPVICVVWSTCDNMTINNKLGYCYRFPSSGLGKKHQTYNSLTDVQDNMLKCSVRYWVKCIVTAILIFKAF